MILIYQDPSCSGLQTVKCKSEQDIASTLQSKDITEEFCGGEIVYYVFVHADGKIVNDRLDFT